MKLYQARVMTTCPRRVTVYMAEKGIDCEIVTIDMRGGEGLTPRFLAMNPTGRVPVLELDDGSFLPESGAIVEYLEELYPDPPMIGTTPEARAHMRATERMMVDFQNAQALVLTHGDDSKSKRRPEFVRQPVVSETLAPSRDGLLRALAVRLGEKEFFGGDRPSIADCSLFAILDNNRHYHQYALPEDHRNLREWFARFSARPSAINIR